MDQVRQFNPRLCISASPLLHHLVFFIYPLHNPKNLSSSLALLFGLSGVLTDYFDLGEISRNSLKREATLQRFLNQPTNDKYIVFYSNTTQIKSPIAKLQMDLSSLFISTK